MKDKEKIYLDKVLGYMVKGTKMDYENKEVKTPFSPLLTLSIHYFSPTLPIPFSFSSYCKNTFGLTKDEIRYLWKEYRNIIINKIEN